MSTHTVHGCYIASTGKFEFDDTAAGCEGTAITGCLVKSGEHAGQVEITHDYGGCETQYYACYDPATGKFQFEADDGCCEEGPEYIESVCCYFSEEHPLYGMAPKYLSATFTGIEDCPWHTGECTPFNGTFIVEATYSPCVWAYGDLWRVQVYLGSDYCLVMVFWGSFYDGELCYSSHNYAWDTCDDFPFNDENEVVCGGKVHGENGSVIVGIV